MRVLCRRKISLDMLTPDVTFSVVALHEVIDAAAIGAL
jgi:hypothetical protein